MTKHIDQKACKRCGAILGLIFDDEEKTVEPSTPKDCGFNDTFNIELCWERAFPGRSFHPQN